MTLNFDCHSIKIYADPTLDSCIGCPFWLVDMRTLETGMCFLTDTEIPLDEKPDMERMNDCPLIIRRKTYQEKISNLYKNRSE